MTSQLQLPIGSGFDNHTTGAEIMEGVDLSGKLAVVTGGYSGIGIETVKQLVAAGAEVVAPARDKQKADEALASAGLAVETRPMDLADLASVQNFAAELAGDHDRVDLLINNAGIMACPETRVGPGWEKQFAVNHIGHFMLTRELAPYLKNADGARVVCLTSRGHKRSPIRWNDIHFTKEPYDKWIAYGQSKTANALFARELNRRMAMDGVKAFSVHPGAIITPLQRHIEQEELQALGWLDENGEPAEAVKDLFKTPEQGCATTLWAATSDRLNDYGGEYCEDCDFAVAIEEGVDLFGGVEPWATNDEAAARLWTETENMIAAA